MICVLIPPGQRSLHDLVQILVTGNRQMDSATGIVFRIQHPGGILERGIEVHDSGVIPHRSVFLLQIHHSVVDAFNVCDCKDFGIIAVIFGGINRQNLAEINDRAGVLLKQGVQQHSVVILKAGSRGPRVIGSDVDDHCAEAAAVQRGDQLVDAVIISVRMITAVVFCAFCYGRVDSRIDSGRLDIRVELFEKNCVGVANDNQRAIHRKAGHCLRGRGGREHGQEEQRCHTKSNNSF